MPSIVTDHNSSLLRHRIIEALAAPFQILPPVLIVASAAALAYAQAPKIEPTIRAFFAPPAVVASVAPVPIEKTPVAAIAPPQEAPQAVTPKPLVIPPRPKPKKPVVARAPRVIAPMPVRRYVYPAYQRPAYVRLPLPIPMPFIGGRGGRMFGGFGGLFGRR